MYDIVRLAGLDDIMLDSPLFALITCIFLLPMYLSIARRLPAAPCPRALLDVDSLALAIVTKTSRWHEDSAILEHMAGQSHHLHSP